MPRIDSASATASRALHVPSVNLIELLLTGLTVRLTTARWPIVWNGHTWLSDGQTLEIGPARETMAVEEAGMSIALTGTTPEFRSMALDAQYIYPGRPLRLYRAFLGPTSAIEGTPATVFRGYVDRMTMADTPTQGGGIMSKVTITAVSRLARLKRTTERRFADEQQRKLHPGDTGLRHLAVSRERTVLFGPPR